MLGAAAEQEKGKIGLELQTQGQVPSAGSAAGDELVLTSGKSRKSAERAVRSNPQPA